jgi:hypothetical protein
MIIDMKKILCIICVAALAVFPLSSCKETGVDSGRNNGKNPGGQGVKPSDLSEECEWIYDELCDDYYWRDAVKAVSPKSGLEYDEFLTDLLSNLPNARDVSENPPTIDGSYIYRNGTFTRDAVCYSYVDRFGADTRADDGTEMLFGFDVMSVSGKLSGKGQLALLVMWVQPGSPAAEAGIKRGTWIEKYNGADIYQAQSNALWNQLHNLTGGTTMNISDDSNRQYVIDARSMKNDPILFSDVLTRSGKKIAYLVYNQFIQGAIGADGWGEFDNELRRVFGTFKTAGATELVLDLRYNHGGAVSSSRLLSSLAGDVSASQTFASLIFNKDAAKDNRWENPEIMPFLNEPNSLELDNIYVLATSSSASSSELVINSLRGVLGNTSDHLKNRAVTHIGDRTEGKNVGMTLSEKTIGKYRYEMWPITFKSENAVGFCDYAGGFEPNYYLEEFNDVYTNGTLYPFGDPNERLLKAALTLIAGGTVDPDPKTRAGEASMTVHPMPHNQRRGGAKIYLDEGGQPIL